MAKLIEYHSGARVDFDESLEWYSIRSPQAAEGFIAAVDEAIDKILAEPDRFPLTYGGCRYCSLGRYPFRLVFHEDSDRLIVFAIAHARRRPGYWHRRTRT